MGLLAPSISVERLILYLLGQVPAGNVVYHLYSNNWTPLESDTLAKYTEVILPGYTPATVLSSAWTVQTIPTGGAVAVAPRIQYLLYGAGTVYGYYVTDLSGANLLWAEAFVNGPFNTLSTGSALQIQPSLSGT